MNNVEELQSAMDSWNEWGADDTVANSLRSVIEHLLEYLPEKEREAYLIVLGK